MNLWLVSFRPPAEFSGAQRRSCRFVIFHLRSIMLIKGMGWKEGPLQLRIHARCQDNLIEPLKTKRRPEGSLSITGLTADDKWHSNLWLKGHTGGFRAASPSTNDKTRRIKGLRDSKHVFCGWLPTRNRIFRLRVTDLQWKDEAGATAHLLFPLKSAHAAWRRLNKEEAVCFHDKH